MSLLRRTLPFFAVFVLIGALAAQPAPSQFLGFELGADRTLADYHQIVSYFRQLEKASPRVELQNLGKTTMGHDMIMAVISSPENLKNKQKYQQIARRLHDPRGLTQPQIEELLREGKAITLVTCSIHSTEIGASQMAMEWAYDLATTQDPEILKQLDDVILLLVPALNPDGQLMITEWYRKHVGSKYEGGPMPWLYHHYVGHDNNRDWYMLTQKETRNMVRAAFHEWFPQMWLDEHQMGSTGPRMFVPPFADPVSPNVHPLNWRGNNLLGSTIALRLELARKSGIIYNYSYDAYWPGGTDTAEWKNVISSLTEVASVRIATPIYIPPSELAGGRKGLIEYTQQINFPNPWPGGWWRLRDIMDHQRIASDALLETMSRFRRDYLLSTLTMAQDAIAAGKPDEYWIIPRQQRDPITAAKLAHLFREHGGDVRIAANGDFYIPTAQPHYRFLDEMLGLQRYPKVKAVAGEAIIMPYDTTAWSLPLLMGVTVQRAAVAAEQAQQLRAAQDSDWPQGGLVGNGTVYALSHEQNNSIRLVNGLLRQGGKVRVAREPFTAGAAAYPAGTFLVEHHGALPALAAQHHLTLQALSQAPRGPATALKTVRVGLYKPWYASMDEGWTRWLLEQYDFAPKSLHNADVKAGKLRQQFDAIIIPDISKNVIMEGRPRRDSGAMQYWADLPPEYAGGIGKEGVEALKQFVEEGGTIVTFGSGGDLLMEEFNIPVRNVLRSSDVSVPGSLLRLHLDTGHPVNYGMPAETAAFVSDAIAYQTTIPAADVERAILAWYPRAAEDILMSGWLQGGERLERRPAAVAVQRGAGKMVLFGFRVQHRAQTEATFKMLFNALHWSASEQPQARPQKTE